MAEIPERSGALGRQLPKFCRHPLMTTGSKVGCVLVFSGGVLEVSGLYLHAYHKAGEVNRVNQDNVTGIEDVRGQSHQPRGGGGVLGSEQLARDFAYRMWISFDIDAEGCPLRLLFYLAEAFRKWVGNFQAP